MLTPITLQGRKIPKTVWTGCVKMALAHLNSNFDGRFPLPFTPPGPGYSSRPGIPEICGNIVSTLCGQNDNMFHAWW